MQHKTLIALSVVLLVALVGTNAWWLRQANSVIAAGYLMEGQIDLCAKSQDQAVALAEVLAHQYPEDQSRAAVQQTAIPREVSEGELMDWVGYLSIEYSADGQLRKIWTYFDLQNRNQHGSDAI